MDSPKYVKKVILKPKSTIEMSSPFRTANIAFNWLNRDYPIYHEHSHWELLVIMSGEICHNINGKENILFWRYSMNRYQEEYQRKLCSAEDIAKRIESNMFFAVSNGVNEPRAITAALCEGLKNDDRKGITYSHSLPLCDNGAFHPELDGKINGVSWFMSGYNRPAYEQGIMDIMPNHLSQMPELYRDYVDVDVFSVAVSPMDEHGYFSYGAICGELRAIERKAKHIFLEVNENMPRTFGDQHIHISKVEAICENHSPLPPYTSAEIDPVSQTIGEFIAAEIPDEATIQLGIGAVPEAVGFLLQEKRDVFYYSAAITEEQYSRYATDSLIRRLYQGSAGKLVAALVKERGLSEDDLAELRALFKVEE